MNRIKSIRVLLNEAEKQLKGIKEEYNDSLYKREISDELKVRIKNYLENLRSCLDYAAKDVSEMILGRITEEDVYFPIVGKDKNIISFEGSIGRNFPGLDKKNLKMYDLIESFQPYHKEFSWLADLSTLVNGYKHIDLVPQTKKETPQLKVINQNGGEVLYSPGIFNDTGGISIRKGQNLVIKAGGSVKISSDRSYVMSKMVNPVDQIPYNDGSLTVNKIVWVDFQFQNINKSSLNLLNEFYAGVKEIIVKIYASIS